MNLHEYQSKQLMASYGLPVLRGFVCYSPGEAEAAADNLGGPVCVVKAQVHAGGRGKAGGVVLVDSDGNETTLTAADYTMTNTRAQTLLTVTDPGDAVTVVVTFDAGYGDTADTLPEALAAWILLDVATLYEQRQALTAGNLNAVPYPFVGGLLDAYRVSY